MKGVSDSHGSRFPDYCICIFTTLTLTLTVSEIGKERNAEVRIQRLITGSEVQKINSDGVIIVGEMSCRRLRRPWNMSHSFHF